jgi:F0F1-type ATP synthase assembly protein I
MSVTTVSIAAVLATGVLVGFCLVWLRARYGETERTYLIYAVPMLGACAAFTYVDFQRRSVLNLTGFYLIALAFTPPVVARLMKNRKR